MSELKKLTLPGPSNIWERNMDDLILCAAIWQGEHSMDRSSILGGDDLPRLDSSTAAKVVLLSFDRMRKLPSYPAAYLSVPDVILFFSSSP